GCECSLVAHRPFPTRRASDLGFLAAHPDIEVNVQSQTAVVDFERSPDVDAAMRVGRGHWPGTLAEHLFDDALAPMASPDLVARIDRKSTRLNSSHVKISYAVF